MQTTSRNAVMFAVALVAALLCAPSMAFSQEAQPDQVGRSGAGPWSVGFQSAWPAWGLSGSFDVDERITAQAIVGAFGTLTNFGGRGLYRFSLEPSYNLYGYGTVGVWNYSGIVRENVVGFGGGGGIELDWRRLFSDDGSFPPLFSTIDLGFVAANFDHYSFSGFTIGSGIHYRF